MRRIEDVVPGPQLYSPNPTKTVLCYGEVLWDILPTGRVLGGAPLNFAFRVSGFESVAASLVSRVGEDDLGRDARELIARWHRLDCHIQTDLEHSTGSVPVTLSSSGIPNFHILPNVAYDYIQPSDEVMELAARAGCIYFGSLIQRAPRSKATLELLLAHSNPKVVKFLDINLRKDCYTEETVRSSLGHADILKLSDEEVPVVCRLLGIDRLEPMSFCEKALDMFSLRSCVVTCGGAGSMAASANGEIAVSPGFRVNVVDTIGSGDAYSAAFVHRYLCGRSLAECCRAGNILGALVAGTAGATAPIDTSNLDTVAIDLEMSD